MSSYISILRGADELLLLERRLSENHLRVKSLVGRHATLSSQIQKLRTLVEPQIPRIADLKGRYATQIREKGEVFQFRLRLKSDVALRAKLLAYFRRGEASQPLQLPMDGSYLEAEQAWLEIQTFERSAAALAEEETHFNALAKELTDLKESVNHDIDHLARRYVISGRKPTLEGSFVDLIKSRMRDLALPQYEQFQGEIREFLINLRKQRVNTAEGESLMADLQLTLQRQRTLAVELSPAFDYVNQGLLHCLKPTTDEDETATFTAIPPLNAIIVTSPSFAVHLLKTLSFSSVEEICHLLLKSLPRGSTAKLAKACLSNELQHCALANLDSSSPNTMTLFRGDGFAEKFFVGYQNLYLKIYCQALLEEIHQLTSTEILELDPLKVAHHHIEANQRKMIELTSHVLLKIKLFLEQKAFEFPKELKNAYRQFFEQLQQYQLGNEKVQLASFFFLRFLCPAMLSHELNTPPAQVRNEILLSKILQSVVNGQIPDQDWMKFIGDFIHTKQPLIQQIVDLLVKSPE